MTYLWINIVLLISYNLYSVCHDIGHCLSNNIIYIYIYIYISILLLLLLKYSLFNIRDILC